MNRITALRHLAPLRQRVVAPFLTASSPFAARVSRSLPQQLRPYSAGASEPPSQHVSFYKTFGRPILKVGLMAIFTYQLGYFGWTYLETSEVKSDAAGTYLPFLHPFVHDWCSPVIVWLVLGSSGDLGWEGRVECETEQEKPCQKYSS